ncbi:MAG: trypsin-like peptidase domain-containing protein [Planctomycetaceae bacterium]
MKLIMLLMMAFDGASDSAPDVQLLDFSAGYCGPCQQMVPILQRMEHAGYPIRQIDITEEPELTKRFNVDRIPTLVLLVEGKEVRRFVGLTGEDELRRAMNKASSELSEKRTATAELKAPVEKTGTRSEALADRPDITAVPKKPSLGDKFRSLLGKDPNASDRPTLRGQDPASTEDLTSDAMKTALAATVRIRVAGMSTDDTKKGEYLQDVGTGTIIHCATGEAIILTCAHLFLNIAVKDAVVEVDVFEDGKAVTYPAKLVGGDNDADLALLRIQTSKTFPVVALSPKIADAKPGQPMVSFGCNGGADPTRLDMKLVAVNRYRGPPMFICTTDPVSGRSGGGLFSANGQLVGVCSCADRKTKEGLYAAHGAILELVDYCELKQILKPTAESRGEDPSQMFKDQLQNPASESPKTDKKIAQRPQPTSSQPDSEEFNEFVEVSPDALLENPVAVTSVAPKTAGLLPAQPAAAAATGPEITITIDDKTSGSQKKTIVIPQASAWMLEMLTGETARAAQPVTAAARRVTLRGVENHPMR